MKLLKYLLWFLFGVILFYIFNNIYYKLQENFTIGAPVVRIVQDNNTHNYSFLYGDNPTIPVDKTLVDDKIYDFDVAQIMLLNNTGIFGQDITQYNGPDPRRINNPNNLFYDSSILVLDGGCPILPTTDPSQLPDEYKVIMIPITKTKDFEILFGLYDPLLAVDYNVDYGQSACAPLPQILRRSNNEVILEQLYRNCLRTDYINMSNTTFNETQVIYGFLRVYDLCRTYELLERDTHETINYMHLNNLQSALETMNTFVLDYTQKKEYVEEHRITYNRVGINHLWDASTENVISHRFEGFTYTYDKYSDAQYHIGIIKTAVSDNSTFDEAWKNYQELISNSQRDILYHLYATNMVDAGIFDNDDGQEDVFLNDKLQKLRLSRRDFEILYNYIPKNKYVIQNKKRFRVYNVYLDKYYRSNKISDFLGSSDTQELPDGNDVRVYLSAIVKNDFPEVTTCEEIIRLGFDNFRVSAQAFVMSIVGTSQTGTDLIQMGYCTSNLYRTGFKRLDGLQAERMPQTALKLHLNVVENLQSSGITLNNLLVSPLPSMMKVLRDHLCIAYNIPMGIVTLGFQDDKNNPNFTLMDKHLMELDLDHRRVLYEIVELLFSNPSYLNRGDDGQRRYIDYPHELPLYTPTKFELERLRYVYNILKSQKESTMDLANANENFNRLMKILFDIQPDSPNTLLELPIELTIPEKNLLKKHKTTDIEGLITHSLLEVANYDYINENIVYRNGEIHPILTMFYQYVEQSVICLDIQKVSARLSDIQSSQQPTIFDHTRSSLVKCKDPLEINCRELSLGTQYAYFRNISHAAGKVNEGDPITTDNTSNMIYKSYVNNNLIILERQIIYSFDIVYTDGTRIVELIGSIGDWVTLEERGYNPIGDNMIINCTTSELIEMLKLQWYESLNQLTQSTSTFGYKRNDELIIDKITSNMILRGIHPVTKETIYIHILRPDNVWKPNNPMDPNEVHYRYMLHYGSCDPSQTVTPCKITDQMYVRYYNPAEARLIGVKKENGLLNVAYENGDIRRPINTDESNNFSEFTFDLATEIKFNDADPSFSATLTGLNFELNTGIVLNPPIQFGLIQRKAHTFGASMGIYHPREYTLINSGTDQSTLQYLNPDRRHIVTDILLSSIQRDSISIRRDDTCLFVVNKGVHISFEYIQNGIKLEQLFIQLELADNTDSSQYRFFELMRSLQ